MPALKHLCTGQIWEMFRLSQHVASPFEVMYYVAHLGFLVVQFVP